MVFLTLVLLFLYIIMAYNNKGGHNCSIRSVRQKLEEAMHFIHVHFVHKMVHEIT